VTGMDQDVILISVPILPEKLEGLNIFKKYMYQL